MSEGILIAPDSFKGSLSAVRVARAMERGVQAAWPGVRTRLCPLSDGGEGLVDVLTTAVGGSFRSTMVHGPLPAQDVEARWGVTPDGRTAVLEMAAAAGLNLVPAEKRDPSLTTTRGVGEVIRAAINAGIRDFIIGIGGSATNDGGAGMADALGVRFLDREGALLPYGGGHLAQLHRIDISGLDPRIHECRFTVACDVRNPLTGPGGASAVYGPQKGADPAMIRMLDQALENYAGVVSDALGKDIASVPGSGAAGGLGAGLLAFCNATLKPGIDVVMDLIGFTDLVRSSTLVLTGEGRLDEQTRHGKVLSGVLARARPLRIPVAAVVGSVEGEPDAFEGTDGFVAVATLTNDAVSGEEGIRRAPELIEERTGELLQRLTGCHM